MKSQKQTATTESRFTFQTRATRRSSVAACMAFAALNLSSVSVFAWIDLPDGSALASAAVAAAPNLPVGASAKSVGVQEGTYSVRIRQLVSGDLRPEVYCEDRSGNKLGGINALERDLRSMSISVTAQHQMIRPSSFARPYLQTSASIAVSAADVKTGSRISVKAYKGNMFRDSEPALGQSCLSHSNGMPDCSPPSSQIGLIQFRESKRDSDIQMRILQPQSWGFSPEVTNACANVVLILSLNTAESAIQSASR